MASKEKREEIFSSYPIPKAVAALAIPSVLSSIVLFSSISPLSSICKGDY